MNVNEYLLYITKEIIEEKDGIYRNIYYWGNINFSWNLAISIKNVQHGDHRRNLAPESNIKIFKTFTLSKNIIKLLNKNIFILLPFSIWSWYFISSKYCFKYFAKLYMATKYSFCTQLITSSQASVCMCINMFVCIFIIYFNLDWNRRCTVYKLRHIILIIINSI